MLMVGYELAVMLMLWVSELGRWYCLVVLCVTMS